LKSFKQSEEKGKNRTENRAVKAASEVFALQRLHGLFLKSKQRTVKSLPKKEET